MHPYREFVNPHLGRLISQLKMDKRYVRGEGAYLFDAEGNRYLDLIAAYGALPFGFNPPEIWEALARVREMGEPSFVQPSNLEAPSELARRLIEVAPRGLRYVTFTNSGAEAVEAAIKLCRARTGRKAILATYNSFHGKTLGALSATGKASYQESFGAPVEGFDYVPYGDAAALEERLAGGEYAAFIVEPIQGEGGIIVPPAGYLREVRRICDEAGVPLIFDEIQTGLGRTGRLFACEEEGVSPDVMTLAKALGGGIFPVGAVLCTEDVYTEEFATKHSSTFAPNTLAARVGLASLELLLRDDMALVRDVAEKGAYLKEGLEELRARYPEILSDVRGKGLMLGIEFGVNQDTFPGSLLGVMAEQEALTPVISSYLLNVEKLRVAPTLNGADVIRIEPPLIITREQGEVALEGLERMLRQLARGNTAAFIGHLLSTGGGRAVTGELRRRRKPRIKPSGDSEEGRFAFLVHPIDLKNYVEFDPSLEAFSEEQIQELADSWNDILQPFVIGRTRVTSQTGATAYGEFIVVPRTAEQLLELPRDQVLDELRMALELARENGAGIVGLGAYTAVASRAGLYLRNEGIAITTGNSYTVVAAAEAVLTALERLESPLSQVTAGIVGAAGSIGRGLTLLLSENVARLILVGNPEHPEKTRARLREVAAQMVRHLVGQLAKGRKFERGTLGATVAALDGLPNPEAEEEAFLRLADELVREGVVLLSSDIDAVLPGADVVITATNSLGKLVTPDNLKLGAVVCDLSRPPNVSREVADRRPDVLVIDGGVIEVPGRPDLGWDFGFEEGLAYACMAETMMLALEHHYQHTSIGSGVTVESILWMRNLAQKHGFTIADLRSFDRPLTERQWTRTLRARREARCAG